MEIALIALGIIAVAEATVIFILVKQQGARSSDTDEENNGESPSVKHMKRKYKKKPLGSAICNKTNKLREERG